MRQNVGLSALIIAAIAFVIRFGAPGTQPGMTARSQPQGAADQTADQKVLDGPWVATRSFFHSPDDPVLPVLNGPDHAIDIDFKKPSSVRDCVAVLAGGCRGQLAHYFGISVTNHVQFLIATVPDPLHSRLSLLTDSSIQAIEDAAQASKWIFAAEWLPWIDSADPEEKDPAKRRQQRQDIRSQEKQPGILVFRRSAPLAPSNDTHFSDDVLLIFLVGETPTTGVNSSQFQLARAYMRAIHEPADEVRILGPTFSGSF